MFGSAMRANAVDVFGLDSRIAVKGDECRFHSYGPMCGSVKEPMLDEQKPQEYCSHREHR
jgi:hypothetical protein